MNDPSTLRPPAGTPDVPRRDIHFDLSDCDVANWHGRGREVSHFFSSMSVLFPEGEKFFIESVRRYKDRITDPKLAAEVQGFIGQEAMHGREHRDYNARLQAAGYDANMLEQAALRQINISRKLLPGLDRLAITIALEHFTAIMAQTLMGDEHALDGSHPEMAAMWRWHAVEETEHKAVAFDVYQLVAGRGFRAYFRRCMIMLSVTIAFIFRVWRNYFHFLWRDKQVLNLRGWGRLFYFVAINPGPLFKILLPWADYFRPGFHPWQHDNRAQLERWRPDYDARVHPAG